MGMRIISWDNITQRTYDLSEVVNTLTVEPITTDGYDIVFNYGDDDYSFTLVNNSGLTITIKKTDDFGVSYITYMLILEKVIIINLNLIF